MGKQCAAYGCTAREDEKDAVKFHRFPLKNDSRRSIWMKAVSRDHWEPTEHSRICSVHFRSTDYTDTGRLQPTAVPSIFPAFSSYAQQEETPSQTTVRSKSVKQNESTSRGLVDHSYFIGSNPKLSKRQTSEHKTMNQQAHLPRNKAPGTTAYTQQTKLMTLTPVSRPTSEGATPNNQKQCVTPKLVPPASTPSHTIRLRYTNVVFTCTCKVPLSKEAYTESAVTKDAAARVLSLLPSDLQPKIIETTLIYIPTVLTDEQILSSRSDNPNVTTPASRKSQPISVLPSDLQPDNKSPKVQPQPTILTKGVISSSKTSNQKVTTSAYTESAVTKDAAARVLSLLPLNLQPEIVKPTVVESITGANSQPPKVQPQLHPTILTNERISSSRSVKVFSPGSTKVTNTVAAQPSQETRPLTSVQTVGGQSTEELIVSLKGDANTQPRPMDQQTTRHGRFPVQIIPPTNQPITTVSKQPRSQNEQAHNIMTTNFKQPPAEKTPTIIEIVHNIFTTQKKASSRKRPPSQNISTPPIIKSVREEPVAAITLPTRTNIIPSTSKPAQLPQQPKIRITPCSVRLTKLLPTSESRLVETTESLEEADSQSSLRMSEIKVSELTPSNSSGLSELKHVSEHQQSVHEPTEFGTSNSQAILTIVKSETLGEDLNEMKPDSSCYHNTCSQTSTRIISSKCVSCINHSEKPRRARISKYRKPFKCEHCPARCLQMFALESHFRKIHAGVPTIYRCKECNFKTTRKSSIPSHEKTRHPKGKNFLCDQCNLKFTFASALKAHMRTHVLHKCDECGIIFNKPHQLRSHLLKHSGEKPYMCDYCDARFSRRDYLKLHITRHTGDYPHKCERCGKGCRTHRALEAHIMSTHTNEKPIKCDGCVKSFNSMQSLKKHVHNVHQPGERTMKVNSGEWKVGSWSEEEVDLMAEAMDDYMVPRGEKLKQLCERLPQRTKPQITSKCHRMLNKKRGQLDNEEDLQV